MAKKSLPKQKILPSQGIKLCEEMLFNGIGRESILQELLSKYKIGEGAVDKWIRAAKPGAESRKAEAEAIRLELLTAENINALKNGLKSDLEIESFLCQIALGDIEVEELIAGVKVMRGVSPTERIMAVKEIFKKRGSYAPIKSATTNKDGEDAVQPFTEDQVDKLINALRETKDT